MTHLVRWSRCRTATLGAAVGVLVAGPALGPASPAEAALGISVPPASLVGLQPGGTATTAPGALVVTTGILEPWALKVKMTAGARMQRVSALAPCSNGAAALVQPLQASYAALLPTTTIDRPTVSLGGPGPDVTVAHGAVAGTVNVSYSQPVGGAEPLVAGCAYAMTVTYTVGPG